MKLPRLRLVTFDVTGTILQFESSVGQQYSAIGLRHGVNCNKDVLAINFKTNWYQLRKEYPNFGKDSIGWYKWWHEMVVRTFVNSDLVINEKTLAAISKDLIESYKTNEYWAQSYGTLGLLSYLRNTGITLGVISNFDERLSELLANTHLRHYFSFVLTSYSLGFEKPDIRIFEEAIKASNIEHLQPHECLHIGDTVGIDYIGAKNAKWNAALICKDNNVQDVLEKYSSKIKSSDIYSDLSKLHKFLLESDCKVMVNPCNS